MKTERLARWLLAPLIVFLVVVAVLAPWSWAWSVDNRTYLEMVSGVSHTGLPFTRNGDFERYRELRAPFNVGSADGRLWGNYPPLFAYVAAPAAMLGGATFVSKLNVLLIALLAICVFALASRVTRRPLVATAASYVVVFSSPVPIVAFETVAQPLLLVLLTLACLAAVASIEAPTRGAYGRAALAGLLGGLAVATHLIAFPMIVMLVLALVVVDGDPFAEAPEEVARDRWSARLLHFLPDRVGFGRGACAAGAFAVTLVPLAFLNHLRFGSWNPISYGPCVWDHCLALGSADLLSPSALLRFALPAAPWAIAVLVGALLARRSPRALGGVAVLAALALVPNSIMRDRVISMLRMIYGYAVDLSMIDFHMSRVTFGWFGVPPDGLGNVFAGGGDPAHGTAIKSMLQCTPILALAALTPYGRRGPGARALVCALPALGLFCYFVLFARFEGAAGFGWPYLFLRYTVPAVPLLAVCAAKAAAELPWRRSDGALALVVAVAGILYFTRALEDGPLLRRILELRATLLIAAISVALTWMFLRSRRETWGRLACVATAVCIGSGVAVSMGVDAFISVSQSNAGEVRIRHFAELTPQRMALAGWGTQTDSVLALRVERDIHYVDLSESHGWNNFREIIDVWDAEKRPIYGIFPFDGSFRWPYADWDVPATAIDPERGFWRIGPARRTAHQPIPGTSN